MLDKMPVGIGDTVVFPDKIMPGAKVPAFVVRNRVLDAVPLIDAVHPVGTPELVAESASPK
jgi:hypothetical protein